MYFVKVVRDGYARLKPGTAHFERLSHAQFVEALRRKLVEEAAEYLANPTYEELADVVDVAFALAVHDLGSIPRLEQARAQRLAERGGFSHGVGMFTRFRALDR